jgi:hypothetical protein
MTNLTIVTEIKVHDEQLVMLSATELGRIHGKDNDWNPANLEEAICELEELREGDSIDSGYEVLSSVINHKIEKN